MQNGVSDANERAESNEHVLAKNRARARSVTLAPVSHLFSSSINTWQN